MQPYPTELPREAFLMVLDKLRGREVETSALVHAGWNVLGFALGQTLGGGQLIGGGELTAEDEIATIESALEYDPADGPAQAFPWLLVAGIVLRLLRNLL
jgi:hypothetical protein